MKKMTSLFADLWSHSKFRTQRKSQQKTDPKSEMTRCNSELHQNVKVCILLSFLGTVVDTTRQMLYETDTFSDLDLLILSQLCHRPTHIWTRMIERHSDLQIIPALTFISTQTDVNATTTHSVYSPIMLRQPD